MPGEDVRESLRVIRGEVGDFVFVPELPARGPHAGMIGRGLAVLEGLDADLQPAGWRLGVGSGRDLRRARSLLAEDLDAAEELLADHAGPVKVQVTGPLTLAAQVERARGDKLVSRPRSPTRAGGVARRGTDDAPRRRPAPVRSRRADRRADRRTAHHRRARRRHPDRQRIRPPPHRPATRGRRAAATRGRRHQRRRCAVRSCTRAPPMCRWRCSPAPASPPCRSISASPSPTTPGPRRSRPARICGRASCPPLRLRSRTPSCDDGSRAFFSRLGFDEDVYAPRTVVTPTCGLAGASPAWARRALSLAQGVAGAASRSGEERDR